MPFPEPTSLQYAAWFRGWNRLEARSRNDDFGGGLAATTADPLWFLARQWQLLELKGEDAGTPIQALINYETASPDQVQLGGQPYQTLNGVPVEVLVEQEKVEWDWRMRVRAGQHYERLARIYDTANAVSLIDDARTKFPIAKPSVPADWAALDLASRRFVSLMEGRAIDGQALYDAINNLTFSSSVSDLWKTWFEDLYAQSAGPASPAWQPTRLDYEFRLRRESPAPTGSLHAASYRNGSVDWDTFLLDQAPVATFAGATTVPLTPVHARYAGQPMRRWWEFEDSAVDFGALDVAKTDLGKLVLMEFALRDGDDWFVLPLSALPNSLIRLKRLEVQDCFGLKSTIAPARDLSSDPLRAWQVFALGPEKRNGATSDFLYVPPSTSGREESPILEEVRFARDEGANMVFAIEHTVPNQLGEPVSGFAAHLEFLRRKRPPNGTTETTEATPASSTTAPPAPVDLKYVLATKVPTNWIPYLATDQQNVIAGMPQRSVKLHRGSMVSTDVEDGLTAISRHSRLLEGVDWVFEEAVGRAGLRVELRRQRMRSAKGETFVWLGRKIGMGKGEARSGLGFDAVTI